MTRQPDDTLLDQLEFSVRIAHCLENEGLNTVGEVRALGPQEMLRLPNFGRKSLRELEEVLGPDPWEPYRPPPSPPDLSQVQTFALVVELLRRDDGWAAFGEVLKKAMGL